MSALHPLHSACQSHPFSAHQVLQAVSDSQRSSQESRDLEIPTNFGMPCIYVQLKAHLGDQHECMIICLFACLLYFKIIHLKRFQFVNGRWIKSQRAVTFPLEGLDPLRYTVQNGNGSSGVTTPTVAPDESLVPCEKNSSAPCAENSPTPQEETPQEKQRAVQVGAEEEKEEELCTGGVCKPRGVVGGVAQENGNGKVEGKEKGTVSPAEPEGGAESANNGVGAEDLPKLYNLFAICVSIVSV